MLETLEANTEQVLKSVAGSKILLEIILLDSEAVSMEKKTKLVQNIVDCLKTVASQDEEKDAPENGGNAPNGEAQGRAPTQVQHFGPKLTVSCSVPLCVV